jgi:hypothetical protein
MFKPQKRKPSNTNNSGFKPTKKKKMDEKKFYIPHQLKVGQKVKITAEHRSQYLCFINKDGTLNNPTYEILSLQPNGGLIIMDAKNPDMKLLVSFMHLVPKENK